MSRHGLGGGVAIVGAGKVGAGLARALRQAGVRVRLLAGRGKLPARPFTQRLLVVAVRDGAIGPVAQALRDRGLVTSRTAVVHVAGSLAPDVLEPLRGVSAGVAQMHPMISFADRDRPPTLRGGHAHVQGDPEAEKWARRLCRAVGLRPRTFPGLDRVAYHAAAGLVANGAAALAAAGGEVLRAAGAREAAIGAMLGPLLRSVADNVEALGLPGALTGPVRRGDAGAVARHRDTLRRLAPDLVDLYLSITRAQVPLARRLGDAPDDAFDRIERELAP